MRKRQEGKIYSVWVMLQDDFTNHETQSGTRLRIQGRYELIADVQRDRTGENKGEDEMR